ncbi:hypothetical protein ACLKA6_000081 [Drosophila palustris]
MSAVSWQTRKVVSWMLGSKFHVRIRGSSTMVLGHQQTKKRKAEKKKSTLDIKQRQHFRFACKMPAQGTKEHRMANGANRIKQLTTALSQSVASLLAII